MAAAGAVKLATVIATLWAAAVMVGLFWSFLERVSRSAAVILEVAK